MANTRPVGQGASVRKYDLLSALAARALAKGPQDQRLTLRFLLLITARYNWATDRLCTGQREIAQMWSVDERTVKREMAHLRERGWLRLLRQGARGRVSEYGMDFDTILADTEPYWAAIGPDFEGRQRPQAGRDGAAGADPGQGAVIPFPAVGAALAPQAPRRQSHPAWERVLAAFRRDDSALCAAWLDPLCAAEKDGVLHLTAPSRFHAAYVRTHLGDRLGACLRRVDPMLGGPEIACPRGDG